MEGYVSAFKTAESIQSPDNLLGTDYDEQHYFTAVKDVVEKPSSEAYKNLGNYMLDHSDPDAAIAAFKKAITLNPKNDIAYYNIGYAYLELFKPAKNDKAMEYFKKALPLITSSMSKKDCLENIGLCYENLKDYPNAIIYYDKAVAQEPNFAKTVHYKLTRVYEAMGNTAKANYHRLRS